MVENGNPVKIGDGCATVTGYKFPVPLIARAIGKAGRRFEARSQDTGLIMLVVVSLTRGRLLRQREG